VFVTNQLVISELKHALPSLSSLL